MKHPRGKSYDPEFKLRLAKEFAETDKTLEEIAQENGKHKNGVGGCGFVVGKSKRTWFTVERFTVRRG